MLRRIRLEEGWTVLLLVWAMVFVSAWSLYQADYLPGLYIFMRVATLGVFAGVLLAKSKFSANTAAIFATAYGLFLVFYLVGLTLPEEMPWRERVYDMINRQVEWFQEAFSGGTSRDGLIFKMQTSIIYWYLGFTAAWYTFRTLRIWRVILPSGLVLLSVVYYYYGDKPLVLTLGLYFLLALLYIVRTHLMSQEKDWRVSSVRYESDIHFSFLRAGFLISLVALTLAWTLPALGASATVAGALSGTNEPWREFQDNWTRMFSALRSYGSPTNDLYQGSLVLGGPRSVSNNPVMDIYVDGELAYTYWQADTLATYEDGAWSPLPAETTLHYPEDGELSVPSARLRTVITQTVVNYIPNASTLYGAPDIVASDRQMYVRHRVDEAGRLLVDGVRSRYLLRPADIYHIKSSISNADATSLRQAGMEYPSWVTESYLQLPEEITPETLDQAAEITAPYDNPYDKALAVRDYLRANITYNDQVPAPPDDVEPIHYTLFDSQEGYCNYYASAMAIMLRSQGIPARLVRGYAQGEFIQDVGAYRIRASDAHTWVEVYFPGYGWIIFEPTSSVPVIVRPEVSEGSGIFAGNLPLPPPLREDPIPLEGPAGGPLPDDTIAGERTDRAAAGGLLAVPGWQVALSLSVLGVLGIVFYTANQLNRRVESDVTRSYSRLASWARWLGIGFRPAQTPYERADALALAVPEGKAPIRNLTRQFVLQTFSPVKTGEADFDPRREWQRLRPILLRKSMAARLKRFRRSQQEEETPRNEKYEAWLRSREKRTR